MHKSKKAIQSGTVLASLAAMVPGIDLLLQSEVIPPTAKGVIIIAGTAIAIIRRIMARSTINGIV